MKKNIFTKLLTFLTVLEREKISYALHHNRDNAIMIAAAVPGEHKQSKNGVGKWRNQCIYRIPQFAGNPHPVSVDDNEDESDDYRLFGDNVGGVCLCLDIHVA